MTRLAQPHLTARVRRMTKATPLSLVLGALLAAACQDLNVPDLNNPAIGTLQSSPTRAGVITATQGLFIGARTNIAPFNGYVAVMGVLGRESYVMNAGDLRFFTELLAGPLDGGGPRTSATPTSCSTRSASWARLPPLEWRPPRRRPPGGSSRRWRPSISSSSSTR